MKKNPLAWVLGISAIFFVIFMIFAYSMISKLPLGGRSSSRSVSKKGGLAVLEVGGVIMDSKKTLEQLEEFEEEDKVKGIILRINSPGGAVAPSQEIYEALKRVNAKKTIYASMSSVAASGGYYIACGTKKVFANPGTMTGSIGVIMQFADLSKLYQWAKINPYAIKTGKFKDTGSPSREMNAEEKALLQSMADNVLSQFRKAVSEARKMPMERVVELSDGRIFSGDQAKAAGLVDELGGLEQTALALGKEVGLEGKPDLIYPEKKNMILEKLFSDMEEHSEAKQFAKVLSGFVGIPNIAGMSSEWMGPMVILPQVLR